MYTHNIFLDFSELSFLGPSEVGNVPWVVKSLSSPEFPFESPEFEIFVLHFYRSFRISTFFSQILLIRCFLQVAFVAKEPPFLGHTSSLSTLIS